MPYRWAALRSPLVRSTRIADATTTQTSAPGMRIFQPNRMNWSYRSRGSVPRSQMKTKRKTQSLRTNHSTGHQPVFAPLQSEIGQDARQPPRNSVVAIAETVTMLTYSARKNRANFSDEYSVWNPPTSSDSASGRSKGARFVSPTIDTQNTTKLGNSRNTNHHWRDCAATISAVDSDPEYKITATIDIPRAIS